METLRAGIGTLELRTYDLRVITVQNWYPVAKYFILHRSIDQPGWTITHAPSRFAVIQRIRTRGQALTLVGELTNLTQKWDRFTDQAGMSKMLNARERSAIMDLIRRVRESAEWSFQRGRDA